MPVSRGELLDFSPDLICAQVPPGEWPDEVCAPSFAAALECIGIRNLVFLEVLGKLIHRDVQAAVGDEPPLIHRVLSRVRTRDEFVVVIQWREV